VVTVAVPIESPSTTQGLPLKDAKERMDVISAYQDVGNLAGSGFDQHGTRKASRLAERGTRQLHSTTGGLRLPAFQDRVT